MRVSIKNVTPVSNFESVRPGELFVYRDELFVKVRYNKSSKELPVHNSLSISGGGWKDLTDTTPVKKVTSIQAEV